MTKYKITRKRRRILTVIILTIIMTTGLLIHRHKRIKYKKPVKATESFKEFKKLPTNKQKPFKFFSYESDDKKLEKFIEIVQAKIKQNKIVEENQRKEQERLRLLEEQRKLEEQKKKELISRGGDREMIDIRVSYYTVSDIECGKSDGITASGKMIQEGMIAAPRNIPFGTRIIIPSMGEYTVEDRGSAIIWSDGVMKIDVYIPNASQGYLNKLGVKYVKGYILN